MAAISRHIRKSCPTFFGEGHERTIGKTTFPIVLIKIRDWKYHIPAPSLKREFNLKYARIKQERKHLCDALTFTFAESCGSTGLCEGSCGSTGPRGESDGQPVVVRAHARAFCRKSARSLIVNGSPCECTRLSFRGFTDSGSNHPTESTHGEWRSEREYYV